MFGLWKSQGRNRPIVQKSPRRSSGTLIESLEDRRLLSVAHHAIHAQAAHARHHAKAAAAITAAFQAAATSTSSSTTAASATTTSSSDTSSTQDYEAQVLNKILLSQAPSAVQTGLTALASKDSLTAPAATDTVYLGNTNGIETYSLVITSSGTTTRLTVDQTGAAVTDPTRSTTTWGTLSGTGAGSNAAAAAEISAIVTALGLTAPTSTTTVNILTASDGTATYSIHLAKSSSSGSSTSTSTGSTSEWEIYDDTTITVDSNGNPVGHQELPFSVLPSAIQNGINAHLPSGATSLDSTSTQNVDVLTANGKSFYTTSFTTSGTTTSVTVDITGALATLPGSTTADFSTIPDAAQTAIQALATANGVSGTIAATQSVTVYDEGNGTTIYSVSLTATDSTTSATYTLTISVDQAGNPTVPPNQGHGGCGGGGDGEGEGDSGAGSGSPGGFGRRQRH